jgi:hypothetical protein
MDKNSIMKSPMNSSGNEQSLSDSNDENIMNTFGNQK